LKLKPSQIRQDGGTQPRAAIKLKTVDHYAGLLKAGAELPAIVVFYDGKDYWLACGFHRLRAWVQAFGDKPIEVDLRQDTQKAAQWFSYGTNKEHDAAGQRRTNPDKKRAVKAALAHPMAKTLTQTQIAAHCGVHQSMVSRYFAPLMPDISGDAPRIREDKNGRKLNTAKIGLRKRDSEPPAEDTVEALIEQLYTLTKAPSIAAPYSEIRELVARLRELYRDTNS
jgi:hypothetical protein